MAGRILVGITSWTEPTLIESQRFYPPDVRSAEDRLRYYASQFPITEVDSTYYALPSEQNSRLWVERTGEDFVFDVKAFRLLTQHPTPHKSLPKDIRSGLSREQQERRSLYLRDLPPPATDEVWSRFESALLPLDSAGKLGVVLFQFPSWFFPGRQQQDYIIECTQRLPQYRVAVEFRHHYWLTEKHRDRTMELLKQHGITYVCVDEPQGFKSSVPPLVESTTQIGVVRFHGRNKESWQKSGISAAERFNYLYSEEELQEWGPYVKRLAEKTREVHVLFNNCHQDKAVINARQARTMFD
ncbi:MAG: DUF72 domain-containing protein [Chloroflexota bacterium]